jgi:hypothetical protein
MSRSVGALRRCFRCPTTVRKRIKTATAINTISPDRQIQALKALQRPRGPLITGRLGD